MERSDLYTPRYMIILETIHYTEDDYHHGKSQSKSEEKEQEYDIDLLAVLPIHIPAGNEEFE